MHLKKGDRLFKNKWPVKDWLVSHIMLDLAVKAVLSEIKLNRTHDIPYLAGYSKNGKTIFIDRHMPKSFLYKGTRIFTDRFLILHETVEKTLISKLHMHYQFAHQIALRCEEAAVRADKISWSAYDKFMQKYIKSIGDESLKKVPKDLDIKPYRDEDDFKLLRAMKQNMLRNKKVFKKALK
jgi:hypothetical protein